MIIFCWNHRWHSRPSRCSYGRGDVGTRFRSNSFRSVSAVAIWNQRLGAWILGYEMHFEFAIDRLDSEAE